VAGTAEPDDRNRLVIVSRRMSGAGVGEAGALPKAQAAEHDEWLGEVADRRGVTAGFGTCWPPSRGVAMIRVRTAQRPAFAVSRRDR
jgi:hypothetical protein